MINKVVIASGNPVKINAVKIGFNQMFSEEQFEFEGIAVPSEVQDQPMDNSTTLSGALNRAKNAEAARQQAQYWIGIEGGIEKTDQEMEAFAWVVIRTKRGTGRAKTGTFPLPPEIVRLIEKGKELGEADDIVFGHTNSKQKNGAVGILTDNAVDRTTLYAQAVALALIPFRNPQHYFPESSTSA